jgi:hypothetical protein
MIVSIHQPQYLPWLPYLMKIAQSDVFILLDSVDFQKNGLQNRNRIKSSQGAQWLTVPVQQKLGQKIADVQIDTKSDWRRKHWQSIRQNYGKAEAFAAHSDELEAVYLREWSSLNELNGCLLQLMLRWLGIKTPIRRSSDMQCTGAGSELVLNLCLQIGAKRYISGTGGHNYLEEEAFRKAGVDVVFSPPQLPTAYSQQYPQAGFLNDLSALDIILNCGSRYRDYLSVTA